MYPVHNYHHYYDDNNRKWGWGYDQRRHSHAGSHVWKGYWKKHHQRPWGYRNSYRERYCDPWREQMFLSTKAYNSSLDQNGKCFSYQAYQPRRKPMSPRKIPMKGPANHYRPGRENGPEPHRDEKQEIMTTEFIEFG